MWLIKPLKKLSRLYLRPQFYWDQILINHSTCTLMQVTMLWELCYTRRTTKEKTNQWVYFSKKLLPAERNYDVFDKELMAILYALCHWRRYLQGTETPVTIFSDHKNLFTFTSQNKQKQRHYRRKEELNFYNFVIKHIEERTNNMLIYYPKGQTNNKV